jgi:hypothetical protein
MQAERNMTPQEKKQLSLSHDCRNGYGENSKSSRKNIPLRRARKHRQYRHAVKQAVASTSDLDDANVAAKSVRRNGWQKRSDIPLAEHIKRQVQKRVRSGQQPA